MVIGILPFAFSDTKKRLQDKDCYMEIRGMLKYLAIVMLIEQDLLYTSIALLDIEFSYEAILFLGKARNKTWLFDLVLKLIIEQWHHSLVNLCG